ncbi:MAG: ATP cone domain-containing protein [archaeon]
MWVIKANGEKAPFKSEKIYRTCMRAGASPAFAREVVNKVRSKVRSGMSTREILRMTLALLKQEPEVAEKYNLKQAIMSLGPSGYAFEKFFARILEHYGYKTRVGRIIQGKCVTHEVDISAFNKEKYLVECKYHNAPGIYTDIKEAMYTYARLLDLSNHFDKAWLATNTKLSNHAKKYANCMGMKITSWGYPSGESLQSLIEKKKLYPVTLLKSVGKYEKECFASANILLVKDLLTYKAGDLLRKTKIQRSKLDKIILDAKRLEK